MMNTDPHHQFSRKIPLITGPSGMEIPNIPAYIPMALPRSRGGKTLLMIARVAGSMSAAPTPITARKAISISGLTEKAVTSEASPKTLTRW